MPRPFAQVPSWKAPLDQIPETAVRASPAGSELGRPVPPGGIRAAAISVRLPVIDMLDAVRDRAPH